MKNRPSGAPHGTSFTTDVLQHLLAAVSAQPHRVRLREVGACALEAEVAEAGLSQPQRLRLRWALSQLRKLR